MGRYLYLIFFAFGPIYWLPGISPEIMQFFKLGIFGLIFARLIYLWASSGARLYRPPVFLFLIAIAAILAASLTHSSIVDDLISLAGYALPLAILGIVPMLGDQRLQEMVGGIRKAPVIFACFAVLVPLGVMFPDLNWINPYSEEVQGFSGSQTFTGFGGSRTGWSLGASLLAAVAFANCRFGTRKSNYSTYFILVVIGAAIFIPGGRVGMASFAFMLFAMVFLGLLKRSTVKVSIGWIFVFIATVMLALTFTEELRLDSLLSGNLAEATTGRSEGWRDGWAIFSSNPFFGVGESVADFRGRNEGYGAIHNTILNFLVKYGLFGTLPMLAVFFWIAVRLYSERWQALQQPIVLVALLMFASISAAVWVEPYVVFTSFYNVVLFWFAIGAFLGVQKKNQAIQKYEPL